LQTSAGSRAVRAASHCIARVAPLYAASLLAHRDLRAGVAGTIGVGCAVTEPLSILTA
jgi:hypothetical protein